MCGSCIPYGLYSSHPWNCSLHIRYCISHTALTAVLYLLLYRNDWMLLALCNQILDKYICMHTYWPICTCTTSICAVRVSAFSLSGFMFCGVKYPPQSVFCGVKYPPHSVFYWVKYPSHSVFCGVKYPPQSVFCGVKYPPHSAFYWVKYPSHSVFCGVKYPPQSVFVGLNTLPILCFVGSILCYMGLNTLPVLCYVGLIPSPFCEISIVYNCWGVGCATWHGYCMLICMNLCLYVYIYVCIKWCYAYPLLEIFLH